MEKAKVVIVFYMVVLCILNGQVIFNFSSSLYIEPACYLFLIVLSIVLFVMAKQYDVE